MTVSLRDLTKVEDFVSAMGLAAPQPKDVELYQKLITSASVFIQTLLNRDFILQSYTENRNGTDTDCMVLRSYPIAVVTGVSIDGVSIPYASDVRKSGYIYDDTAVYLRGYKFSRGVQNVAFTYTAGFVAIPEDIAQATIELAAKKLKLFNLKGERLGIDSMIVGGQQINYSKSDITKDIRALLNQYAKVAPI